jgi:hypothetical protein
MPFPLARELARTAESGLGGIPLAGWLGGRRRPTAALGRKPVRGVRVSAFKRIKIGEREQYVSDT